MRLLADVVPVDQNFLRPSADQYPRLCSPSTGSHASRASHASRFRFATARRLTIGGLFERDTRVIAQSIKGSTWLPQPRLIGKRPKTRDRRRASLHSYVYLPNCRLAIFARRIIQGDPEGRCRVLATESHQRGRSQAEDGLQPRPGGLAPRSGVAPVNLGAKRLQVDVPRVVTEFKSDGLDVAAKTR